jgi:hypothetical protein
MTTSGFARAAQYSFVPSRHRGAGAILGGLARLPHKRQRIDALNERISFPCLRVHSFEDVQAPRRIRLSSIC